MYLDRDVLTEYPFNGIFYERPSNTPVDGDYIGDGDLLNDTKDVPKREETTTENILFETVCDIQQAAKLINSGTIMADYKVFFPCGTGERLPIRFNTKFRCDDYVIPVQGYVVGLEYSQLGGCYVDIKMNEI